MVNNTSKSWTKLKLAYFQLFCSNIWEMTQFNLFIKTHRDSQDFWVESLVQYVQISSHCQEGPISLRFFP